MINKNTILAFIEGIELFKGLSEKELNILAENIEVKKYSKKDLLFEENGPRTDIFIIYEGEVELFKTPRLGSETKLAYFKTGDFLGEGSWASNTPHSTSARALQKTTVLSIKKDFF